MHPLKTYIVEDSPVIRENLIATLEELLPVEVVSCACTIALVAKFKVPPVAPAMMN